MSDQSRVVDPTQGLVEGQQLDQPTFHALYEAMPPGTWAEKRWHGKSLDAH